MLTRYRHKKTGNVYEVLRDDAIIEATMERAVVYRPAGSEVAPWWVRPHAEFADGRFEQLEECDGCDAGCPSCYPASPEHRRDERGA